MPDVAATAPASLWRDFRYYLLWWVVWVGIFSALQPVFEPGDFWIQKAWQVIPGLFYGMALGCVFTLAQNTMNKKRRKALSWVLAIATAIVGKAINLAVVM